jgi:gamma-glutamylcyclotransferase
VQYLAYGSNLHPLRLILRVPGARLVGTTCIAGARVTFHKRSTDGSGKCSLDINAGSNFNAYGAVFDIPDNEIGVLDNVEGLGNGYFKSQLPVTVDGLVSSVFTYLASSTHISADVIPYDWYKGLVVAGARKHNFPQAYVEYLVGFRSQPDPGAKRRLHMENLLVQLVA